MTRREAVRRSRPSGAASDPAMEAIRAQARLERAIATILLMVLSSCGDSNVRAPFPEVTEDLTALPALSPSFVSAPIALDLLPIVAAMEREVPRRFGSMDDRIAHPSNPRAHVAFEVERAPFTATFTNTTAQVRAILRYRGRGWYDPPVLPEVSASCGTADDEDNRPRAEAALSSPISVAEDWTLVSDVRVDWIRAASEETRDQCRVTAFGIDVTERVIRTAEEQLGARTRAVEEAIAGIDLRSRVERVWEILRAPVELTDQVWLVIDPYAVYQGDAAASGHTLEIDVGLEARPRIVLGPRPEVEQIELPHLQQRREEETLRILVEGEADYGSAGEVLTRELAGRELRWAGNEFRIVRLALAGIGSGRVALAVEFEGTARGTIYLVGTPELDEATNEIRVPDLDFDVATRHVLARGVAWIGRGNLVDFLRDAARIPADDLMELAREQLASGLNRQLSDEVRIEGTAGAARVLGVRALTTGLIVQSEAEASAKLFVNLGG